MKKPEILEKLEEEYRYTKEAAKKFDQEFDYTQEEFIRKKYSDLTKRKTVNRGVLSTTAPSYAEIKEFEEAILYLDSKENKSSSNSENKQGTARQLALAFHFMVQAKHLPKGTLDYTKNADFIQFLTGKGSENVRKKLGSIKLGEVSGINTEKEIRSLINDLTQVQQVFNSVLFTKEAKLISTYIDTLHNDLSSLDD